MGYAIGFLIGYFSFGIIAALIETWREAKVTDEFPWLTIFVSIFVPPIVVLSWIMEFVDWAQEWKNPFYKLRN